MTAHEPDVLKARVRRAEELVAQWKKVFSDDVHFGARQEMVQIADAAGEGVFDGKHSAFGVPGLDRLQRFLKRAERRRLEIGREGEAGDLGIGAGLALIDDGPSTAPIFSHCVPFSVDRRRKSLARGAQERKWRADTPRRPRFRAPLRQTARDSNKSRSETLSERGSPL